MEIKIGIIENEMACADSLTALLHQWASDTSLTFQLTHFTRGEDILNQDVFDHHILFIDIQLGGIDGVKTARKLREKKYSGELVFLTAYHEYVFEGYEVQALNYIMKPIPYEKLKNCMDSVVKSLQNEYYILRNRDIVEKIPCNDILYIISSRHHMELITAQNSYRHLISIKNILKCLPPQFIQCHRTVIINIDHVRKLEGHDIVMQNKKILPVSNTYLPDVRKKLESLVF